ncbi:unnamed protein product, partial [Lymnaea stagnalis]
GLSGNACSFRTFVSMGLRDWVTITFAWLAVADSFFLMAVVVISFAYFVAAIEQWNSGSGFMFPADPFAVGIFFVNCGGGPYTLTMLTTTFIALARCMGVVKPLTFRHSFSRMRTVAILSTFSVLSLLSVIPILIFMDLKRREGPAANSTRLFLWLSQDRKQVKDILWPIRDAFLPLSAQVILLLCVYFMAGSLHESSRFRRADTRQSKHLPANAPSHTRDSLKADGLQGRDAQKTSNPTFHLSGKELKVIQQMLFISSIFIVCNTPKIVLNLTELCFPEFNIADDLQGVYYTMVNIRDFFQTVNSSVNIFIYYHYSSKFRQHFKELF